MGVPLASSKLDYPFRKKPDKQDRLPGSVPRAHIAVIVMGDMNAHIGILAERMNRNGEMIEEFVDEMGLENQQLTTCW